MKAMVADDDDELRKMIGMMLRQEGFEVVEARDGREALRLYMEHGGDFQLVTLDYLMPYLNGDMVKKGMEEAAEDLGVRMPVVKMLTGAEDAVMIARTKAAGIYELLIKPQGIDFLRDSARAMAVAR